MRKRGFSMGEKIWATNSWNAQQWKKNKGISREGRPIGREDKKLIKVAWRLQSLEGEDPGRDWPKMEVNGCFLWKGNIKTGRKEFRDGNHKSPSKIGNFLL